MANGKGYKTGTINSVSAKLLEELDRACVALQWSRNTALARLVERPDFADLVQAGLARDCELRARREARGRPDPPSVKRITFNLPARLVPRLALAAESSGCGNGDVIAAALMALRGKMKLALLGTLPLSSKEKKILAQTA